jgi:beta-glucosidase
LEDKLTTPKGESGWLCVFYSHDSEGNPSKEIASFVLEDTRVKLNDFLPEGLTPTWSLKLTGDLKVDRSAPFEFGLTVAGRAKLFVNGKLTIDNWTKQRPGEFFYG